MRSPSNAPSASSRATRSSERESRASYLVSSDALSSSVSRSGSLASPCLSNAGRPCCRRRRAVGAAAAAAVSADAVAVPATLPDRRPGEERVHDGPRRASTTAAEPGDLAHAGHPGEERVGVQPDNAVVAGAAVRVPPAPAQAERPLEDVVLAHALPLLAGVLLLAVSGGQRPDYGTDRGGPRRHHRRHLLPHRDAYRGVAGLECSSGCDACRRKCRPRHSGRMPRADGTGRSGHLPFDPVDSGAMGARGVQVGPPLVISADGEVISDADQARR